MTDSTIAAITWAGIGLCVLHSAMFSGLNLALFGISRLRLEIEVANQDPHALKILSLRQDSNFLLSSILWGNVAINCLLTLLSDSVLTGIGAFVFSTVAITFLGEIFPQAYFSRHALRVGALLAPVLRFYQKVLWPVARPTAMILDLWLGAEGIQYFREKDLRAVIRKHLDADESDLDHFEGVGALNFLALDDLAIGDEGEIINPDSIIALPVRVDLPVFPEFERSAEDPFIAKIEASHEKWVILTDENDVPQLVLDSDGFLRALFLSKTAVDPYEFCHRPVIVRNKQTPLGKSVRNLKVKPENPDDDVIDQDIILLWTPSEKRVITGADLLGRLLRGIVSRKG